MKNVRLIVLAACLVSAGGAAAAGDPAAGKAKADQACASCHGAAGISISSAFPNLAGQYASYLYQALKQYAGGKRDNAIMLTFATQLSDQEMKDVAAWYASQSGLGTLKRD